jgi:hypothetical protein
MLQGIGIDDGATALLMQVQGMSSGGIEGHRSSIVTIGDMVIKSPGRGMRALMGLLYCWHVQCEARV